MDEFVVFVVLSDELDSSADNVTCVELSDFFIIGFDFLLIDDVGTICICPCLHVISIPLAVMVCATGICVNDGIVVAGAAVDITAPIDVVVVAVDRLASFDVVMVAIDIFPFVLCKF